MVAKGSQGPFLAGVAISVYQNSGGPGTNWEDFENQKRWWGSSVIEGGGRCGKSSDFWNKYEADIARVAALNSNCFRFSLEWSRIEPSRGVLDQEGIARYHAIFDCCARHKLEPMVTLHHFAHPTWFEKLGAFERAENIPIFVTFAETAFREFGSKARLWCTFNEANVMTFCGYLYAHFPPAKLANFGLAGRHLLHMLQAHAATYKALKALPGGQEAQIGIVHNFLHYRPKHPDGLSNVYIGRLCKLMERIWATDIMLEYFTTGRFCWSMPLGSFSHQDREKPGLDWIGMNYYGRVILDWKFATTCRSGETMTDMPFPLYAPGIYDGCKELSALRVPIYITETGVADEKDVLRPQMMETYFAQMERCVRDGIDLRGVMYWTLVDNWEWAHGFSKKFGLFSWSPGQGKARGNIPSTALLATIFKNLPSRMAAIRNGEKAM